MGIYYGDPRTPIDLGKVQRQNEANIADIQRSRQNPAKTPVLSNRTPSAPGVEHPGVSNEIARQDHVHPGGDGSLTVQIISIHALDMGWSPTGDGLALGSPPLPTGHVIAYEESSTPPICTIHSGEGYPYGVPIPFPIPFPSIPNPYDHWRSYMMITRGFYVNEMASSGVIAGSTGSLRDGGLLPPTDGHYAGFTYTAQQIVIPGVRGGEVGVMLVMGDTALFGDLTEFI